VLEHTRGQVQAMGAKVESQARRLVEARRSQQTALVGRLSGLSPLAVLGRGYAIALRSDGRALRRAAEVQPGDALRIRVHEGEVEARVTAAHPGDQEAP
jgi:exodeoxyribonuclease VII large subunit